MALTKVDKSVSSTPGIVDNSNATAITIDSSERVGIGLTSPASPLHVRVTSDANFEVENASGVVRLAALNDARSVNINMEFTSTHFGFLTGNLGLGTTTINTGTLGTANKFLEVAAGTANGSGTIVLSRTTNGNNNEIGGLRFVNTDNADDDGLDADGKLVAAISARSVTSDSNASDDSGANLLFYTKPEASNYGERMRIDSFGRVMVNATSASEYFEVKGAMGLQASNSTNRWSLYTYTDNTLRFNYNGAGGDELTMNSSGDFAIGKSSFGASTAGFAITNSGVNVYSSNSSSSSSTYHVHDGSNFKFYVGYNGYIYAANTTVQSTSDERLKENIRDLDKGLSDILKLKPRRFDWKEGEGTYEKDVSGFIAQEAEEAGFDEFVSNFKHKTLDDAKSFGQGGLIPALVKAIQEQQAIIEDLQTQINEVKNGN